MTSTERPCCRATAHAAAGCVCVQRVSIAPAEPRRGRSSGPSPSGHRRSPLVLGDMEVKYVTQPATHYTRGTVDRQCAAVSVVDPHPRMVVSTAASASSAKMSVTRSHRPAPSQLALVARQHSTIQQRPGQLSNQLALDHNRNQPYVNKLYICRAVVAILVVPRLLVALLAHC